MFPFLILLPLFLKYGFLFILFPGTIAWGHSLYYRYLDVSNGDDYMRDTPSSPTAHEDRFAKFFALREKPWF